MTGLKNTLITAIIGGILTIMAQGLSLGQGAPMPVAYKAPPAPLSTADWLWWQVVWWLLPVAIVALVGTVALSAVNKNRLGERRVPRTIEEKFDVKVKGGQLAPLETPAIDRTFSDGLRKLTRTEIPLGYTSSGEIITWDVTQAPHVRVHGKTQGSGKTNLIKQICIGAIKAGHHVIVLDRRSFKDWGDFRNHAEFIDNRRPGSFVETTKQVKEFYQRRDQVLGRTGAGNIEDLPGAKWPRVFVVIAEFGTACREAPETDLKQVVANLKSIMSESGATGVHLVYESQVVNYDWPRELRGNGDPICGYLPEDTSKAGGYSYAYELKPYEFHYDGERFKTWDMKKYAWQVLTGMPTNGKKLIVQRSVTENDTERSVNVTERRPNGDRTANTLENGEAFGVQRTFGHGDFAQGNPETNNISDRTPNAERSADLRDMVWQWRNKHPTGTQAELRKEFADKRIDIARGYVHACWHSWNEKG